MSVKLKEKAVTVICSNCLHENLAIRDGSGIVKYKCPKCGAVTVSKVMSRRHVQIDVYAPNGQQIVENDS